MQRDDSWSKKLLNANECNTIWQTVMKYMSLLQKHPSSKKCRKKRVNFILRAPVQLESLKLWCKPRNFLKLSNYSLS